MSKKLNQLLHHWPRGAVYTTTHLAELGITKGDLAQYKNNWLYRVGHGAYARIGDKPDWTGGVYALQTQLNFPVHVGGITALHMSGYGHFLPLGSMQIHLFGKGQIKLPKWFLSYNWNVNVRVVKRNLFEPFDRGLTEVDIGAFRLRASSPERGAIEVASLIKAREEFDEFRQVLENLTTLRPSLLQELLENCKSIKTKRVFLFLAKHMNQKWYSDINKKQVDLGHGKRQIIPDGILDSNFQITVPKEFKES